MKRKMIALLVISALLVPVYFTAYGDDLLVAEKSAVEKTSTERQVEYHDDGGYTIYNLSEEDLSPSITSTIQSGISETVTMNGSQSVKFSLPSDMPCYGHYVKNNGGSVAANVSYGSETGHTEYPETFYLDSGESFLMINVGVGGKNYYFNVTSRDGSKLNVNFSTLYAFSVAELG